MKTLYLYTTEGCHLCENAEKILNELEQADLISWQPVEISDSDELIGQYGVRIPVVREEGTDREIGWPFELEQLYQWLHFL